MSQFHHSFWAVHPKSSFWMQFEQGPLMTHSSSLLCFPGIFCKVELIKIMLWDSGSGITEQNQSLNQRVFIKPSSNSLGEKQFSQCSPGCFLQGVCKGRRTFCVVVEGDKEWVSSFEKGKRDNQLKSLDFKFSQAG